MSKHTSKKAKKHPQPAAIVDPRQATTVTESGELERPMLYRRKIDCGGKPEIAERRVFRGPGRPDIDHRAAS